jgi:hypothetical protein
MKQSFPKKSLINTNIDIVDENTNNSTAEAAECLLKSFYTKFEDSFVNIAIEKCLIKTKLMEKMDVISTEAMLQEANISTNSARIINHHLWQHFVIHYLPLRQSGGDTLLVVTSLQQC